MPELSGTRNTKCGFTLEFGRYQPLKILFRSGAAVPPLQDDGRQAAGQRICSARIKSFFQEELENRMGTELRGIRENQKVSHVDV